MDSRLGRLLPPESANKDKYEGRSSKRAFSREKSPSETRFSTFTCFCGENIRISGLSFEKIPHFEKCIHFRENSQGLFGMVEELFEEFFSVESVAMVVSVVVNYGIEKMKMLSESLKSQNQKNSDLEDFNEFVDESSPQRNIPSGPQTLSNRFGNQKILLKGFETRKGSNNPQSSRNEMSSEFTALTKKGKGINIKLGKPTNRENAKSFVQPLASKYMLLGTKTKAGPTSTAEKSFKKEASLQEDQSIFSSFANPESSLSPSSLPTVECIGCKATFQFEPGDPSNSPTKDLFNNPLSESLRRLYASNRMKCSSCGLEQCRLCKASPYHTRYTCQEYKAFPACRFCEDLIIKGPKPNSNLNSNLSSNPGTNLKAPLKDCCGEREECVEKERRACGEVLSCGHRCSGYRGEKEHVGCTVRDCPQRVDMRAEMCTFCNEDISKAPAVRLGCQDWFHYRCLEKHLRNGPCTDRLTFFFLNCPNCKKEMKLPQDCPLHQIWTSHFKKYQEVRSLCLNKLKTDKKDNDPEVAVPGKRYFNYPESYALKIYACYDCNKCKKPFIGGLVSCEEQAAQLNRSQKEKHICQNCSGEARCPVHGTGSILHKCHFCCQPASWFCWGTTHFCNECHAKQMADSNFVTKGPFKPCDPSKCLLKGDHAPAPSSKIIRCLLCDNFPGKPKINSNPSML